MFLHMLLSLTIAVCLDAASIPIPGLRPGRVTSNSLSPNGETNFFKTQDWVKVTEASPTVVKHPLGTRVELECEAIGSPSPTIQWLKGDTALTDNDSYEPTTNDINDSPNQGLAKIKSRLVIPSLLPIHQGVFTCLAQSGSKTAISRTNVYVVQGNPNSFVPHNFSDFLTNDLAPLSRNRVRIVLFNTMIMDGMGSDIIMPCKAINETPGAKVEVYWIDNNDQVIMNQDPRVKVLPDGELRIEGLTWSDMGPYTCVAHNGYSKDTIHTFVYPMLNEK